MPTGRSGGQSGWLRVALPVAVALLLTEAPIPAWASHQVAGPRPLWEAGVAAGWSEFATYPGSARRRVVAAGVPWFVYRGETVRATGRSLRLILFETPRAWGDITGGGWIPVDSAAEPLRQGMPDLDAVAEAGPRYNRRVLLTGRTDLVARVAVRSAWSLAALDDTSHRGYVVEPALRAVFHPAGEGGPTQWGVALYAEWADAELNQYYYGVSPSLATPSRPAWRAGAGWRLAGARFSVARRIGERWQVGLFVSPALLPDPVRRSPLVARDVSLTAGAGLTCSFARSRRMVSGPEAGDDHEP